MSPPLAEVENAANCDNAPAPRYSSLIQGFRTSAGSFATFATIRRASSLQYQTQGEAASLDGL
jgi:hypothetical protein